MKAGIALGKAQKLEIMSGKEIQRYHAIIDCIHLSIDTSVSYSFKSWELEL